MGGGGGGGCVERQKVRGRGVLMAVCRVGLWGRGIGACVGGWIDGEGYRWSDGRERGEVGGEGSVVSSWPLPRPLIRAAQVCRE